MTEKRNSITRSTQSDLFEGAQAGRVGARQAGKASPRRGGGYRKICGEQNFCAPDESAQADPRFAELARIGLPAAWRRIAERVGFDAWIDVWKMLSADDSLRHDGGQKMPKLRTFDAYLRYQRDRYIESLAQAGANDCQIQQALLRNIGETLDVSRINRLARKSRAGKRSGGPPVSAHELAR
jgi:hypothetical protein